MSDENNERREGMDDLKNDIKAVRESMNKIEKWLLGNGNIGLFEQVRHNSEFIKTRLKMEGIVVRTLIVLIVSASVGYIFIQMGIQRW